MRTGLRVFGVLVVAALVLTMRVSGPAMAGQRLDIASFCGQHRGLADLQVAGHPLHGLVLDAAKRAPFSGADSLRVALRQADVLLLGEIHDNPAHHVIQACLLDEARTARTAAVVFEQIRVDQAPALADYLARADATAGGIGPALAWAQSGWPPWAHYQPIAETALARGLAIRAGDGPRSVMRAVARGGASALDAVERERVGLDAELAADLEAALRDELVASHCNMMPAAAFGGMATAQRYRDAHLAAAIVEAWGEAKPHEGKGEAGAGPVVVLIAGNGHVRSDRAVPWHLRRMRPQSVSISVAIVEVGAGSVEPMALVPKAPDGSPAADIVIFTPVAERDDPCEQMRRHMQSRGKGTGSTTTHGNGG